MQKNSSDQNKNKRQQGDVFATKTHPCVYLRNDNGGNFIAAGVFLLACPLLPLYYIYHHQDATNH